MGRYDSLPPLPLTLADIYKPPRRTNETIEAVSAIREHLSALLQTLEEYESASELRLAGAAWLLGEAMRQGCTENAAGWLDTRGNDTWRNIGNWLCEHAGWKQGGFGLYREGE